jgi:hypothetical protein
MTRIERINTDFFLAFIVLNGFMKSKKTSLSPDLSADRQVAVEILLGRCSHQKIAANSGTSSLEKMKLSAPKNLKSAI